MSRDTKFRVCRITEKVCNVASRPDYPLGLCVLKRV